MSDLFREQKEDKPLNFLELEEIKPESSEDVRKRAREAIQFIKNLDCKNVGVISHGFFIWYFLEQCGQKPQPTCNCQAITFQV